MEKEQVLIVEDDADIREGVRILLESENYHVSEAENGRKGLELLNDETDLVILDVMMPGMSGLRTCEEIRKVSNVPVLFLTAKAQESDKLIGLMAGGDDYLPKPFSYAELLGRVKALMRRYKVYMGKNPENEKDEEPYLEMKGIRIHETFNEVFVNDVEKDIAPQAHPSPYKGEGQWKEYVEKIDRKARRMKQLTDHLFEYSLTAGEEEVQLEEPETCETLFYDLFSETCSYLEQQGFEVSFQVEWPQSRLRISTDYVMRIMDNLTSNIMKYADTSMPVAVSAVEEGSMVGFLFENKVKKPEEETESNGIGIQSVKNMMAKMKGKCMTEQEGERFRVLLLFPGQTV